MSEAKVDTPSIQYGDMAERWRLIEDLCGGTLAMRKAGATWLPREPAETPESYSIRLNRATLYECFSDTLDEIATKPFAKPVQVGEDLPERLAAMLENIDGMGSNATTFASALFRSAVKYGKAHILVDYPATTGTLTLRDERTKAIMPRFVLVEAPSLISWTTEAGPNGAPVLKAIRIKQTAIEPDGEWGEQAVEYVRVYEPAQVRVFRKAKGEKDYIEQAPLRSTLGKVALVTLNLWEPGTMVAQPPLEKLAWENLHHWQSSADQNHALRIARFALLWMKGLSNEEFKSPVTVGPTRIFKSTSDKAEMSFIETSGAALKAGAEDICACEQRMRSLGAAAMSESGDQTATAKAIDEAGIVSGIKGWIRLAENALEQAFGFAADWVKETLPDGFSVDIFDEFSLSLRSNEELTHISAARRAGDLDRQTFIAEFKRRGVLGESATIEDIESRLAEEGPSLAEAGFGGQSGGFGGAAA